MHIQVVSDCHIERRKSIPKIEPLAEYLFLAGDIGHIEDHKYKLFMDYVSDNWKKIVIVLGNNEYYSKSKSYDELLSEYREFFEDYENIFLLEKESIKLDRYTVYGATLWSKLSYEDFNRSCREIKRLENGKLVKIGLRELNRKFFESKSWLLSNYKQDEPTIVITHYPMTLAESFIRPRRFKDEPIEYLHEFGSDYFLPKPKSKMVCISGHTHFSHNFISIDLDGVKYISNQMGYPDEGVNETGFEKKCLFRI